MWIQAFFLLLLGIFPTFFAICKLVHSHKINYSLIQLFLHTILSDEWSTAVSLVRATCMNNYRKNLMKFKIMSLCKKNIFILLDFSDEEFRFWWEFDF